ncbi:prepilin peptidase [Thiorhodovibrio frisius]|uniref:Prepilin leader peptidase/N-methyltransferase n=1 Tax=Thiorhodovibrio frisius TaxID=631362 RepID=H8YXN1_9GAMM|nr:A24 family peptidase [Thiorhodovibrio frisius]EIC23207.1 prepilin signal peptidase PulO-like peptidase [Thiorhodovibrio frisius]WPL23716.1 Pectic enzymes secretion protein OutO [Thiorhodovibrio frisius]
MSDLIRVLAETPWLLYSTTVLLGLVVGSFLNVVILRLPRMMELEWHRDCAELLTAEAETASSPSLVTSATPSPIGGPSQEQSGEQQSKHEPVPEQEPAPFSLARPASHCPSCSHRIRAWENIPVLSYLLLRGRCSACRAPIAIRYPLIETLTAVLSLVVVWHFGFSVQAAAALVFTWSMVALAVIDFDTQLLPDAITLPVLWGGLLLSLFGVFVDAETAIIGAIAGYLSLWSVFQLFRVLTGREGMGRGDFKLLALFGAWMGWQALPQIILLSAVPGALVGIALIALGRQKQRTPMPFGPYLAIAGWVSLLWGAEITEAYLRWSGLG